MPSRATSIQRLGALLLVVIIVALLSAVLLIRGCDSQPQPQPVKTTSDTALMHITPDSSRLRQRTTTPHHRPRKRTATPHQPASGSPLDHKL